MKDETKEITQFDAVLEKNLEDFMGSYKMVDVEQVYSNGIEFVPIFRVKQWLEYNNITNLQEENEFLKLNNPEMNMEHFRIIKENKRKINNLREENKRLKEIEKEHKNCTRKHWQQKCAEHCTNEMLYKSKIDKAIEYINENSAFMNDDEWEVFNKKELLKILNGGDE